MGLNSDKSSKVFLH